MNGVRGGLRYPLLGVMTLALGLGSVLMTFAVYQKSFADPVLIEVRLQEVEDQLDRQADVKVRGVRVGEVRSLTPADDGVSIQVAIDEELADRVPSDVTARVIPKTLFGEKYIDLVPQGASDPIREGQVIAQDLGVRSVRLQEVFDSLDPLLRTVRPADLNAATSSLATALSGNGARLGRTLEAVGSYSRSVRDFIPSLQADLALLADVASVYGRVAPDLLAITRNAVTVIAVVQDEIDALSVALDGTAELSRRVRVLLEQNEETLVGAMRSLRPTLQLLEEFAPEFDCVFNGAKLAIQRIYDVFGGDDGPFVIRGRLRIGQTRGVYARGFEPDGALQAQLLEELREFGPSCPIVTTASVGGTPNADIPAPALALIGSYRGLLGLPVLADTGAQQETEQQDDNPPSLLGDDALPGGLLEQLPIPFNDDDDGLGILSNFVTLLQGAFTFPQLESES